MEDEDGDLMLSTPGETHLAKQPEEKGIHDTVRDLKRRDPYLPFRVVMTSGEGYTIEHPDLLAMNETQLVYCVPRSNRVLYLRLAEIVTIDDLGERPASRRRRRAG
jgi:hypothetical protein